MWFFGFMIACVVMAVVGIVWHQLFWWSMGGCGLLWLVGSLVEVLALYRPRKARQPGNGRRASPSA